MISMTFTGHPFLKSCRFLQSRPPKPTPRFRTIQVRLNAQPASERRLGPYRDLLIINPDSFPLGPDRHREPVARPA